eukprot:INCI3193.2.p1 GENE.INCI3193.2~~INCI3193.2.p1  ORF type:complete len:249 (-),score=34.35 INCI3193.2:484-1230(-)
MRFPVLLRSSQSLLQKRVSATPPAAAFFTSSLATSSRTSASQSVLPTQTLSSDIEGICGGGKRCARLAPHRALRRSAHTLVGSTEPILYKKCRFMGTLFTIDSPDDVEHALASLVASNSRVRKSTHPHMHAWVCGDRAGSHDCGESTAGRKILTVLENSKLANQDQGNASGYLVTVTRWYGGSHLGSARWRIIAASARAALQLLDEAAPSATSGTTGDNTAAPSAAGDHSGGTKRQRKRQRVRRKRKR